jgi:hypothetical protein
MLMIGGLAAGLGTASALMLAPCAGLVLVALVLLRSPHLLRQTVVPYEAQMSKTKENER